MKLVISSHCFLELLLIAIWVRRQEHVEKRKWRNECVDNVCSLRHVVFGIDHPAAFAERLVMLNWSVFPNSSEVQAAENSTDPSSCLPQTEWDVMFMCRVWVPDTRERRSLCIQGELFLEKTVEKLSLKWKYFWEREALLICKLGQWAYFGLILGKEENTTFLLMDHPKPCENTTKLYQSWFI